MTSPSKPPHTLQDLDSLTSSQDREVLRPTQKAVSRVIDGQALILDATRDEIRQLNDVGSMIWSMILKSKSTRDDILKAVVNEFEVEVEQASVDLDVFITQLDELVLIERVSPMT